MGICRLRVNRVCYALGEPAAGVPLLPDHPWPIWTSHSGQQAASVSRHGDRQSKATLLPVPEGHLGRWGGLFLPAPR